LKVFCATLCNPAVSSILEREWEALDALNDQYASPHLWPSLRDLASQMDDFNRRKSSTADALRRSSNAVALLNPVCSIYRLPKLPSSTYRQHVTNLIDHAPWGGSLAREGGAKAFARLRRELEANGTPQEVRRQLVFGEKICSNRNVEYVGDPWEAPLRSNEVVVIVLAAYWVAKRFEAIAGFRLDIRFLGSYSFLAFFTFVVVILWIASKIPGT